MNVMVLAAIGLLVLVGLIAVGLGHRRWNWGTVAAAFLLIVSTSVYLYLAARVAARDRGWMRAVRRYETDIARVRDALEASPRVGLAPIEGQQSLAALRADRDRWQRTLTRVQTWRSPGWDGASFTPPQDAAATGQIELPAEGNDKESPPLQPGAHLFVFDEAKLEDGGRYLGEFRVKEAKYDEAVNRWTLTVAHAAGRDAADEDVLSRRHDAVAVYEDLPVDRWLAFYRTQPPAEAAAPEQGVVHEPVKATLEQVEATLTPDGKVGRLVQEFIENFKKHDEIVPRDEWPEVMALAKQGTELPGTIWAVVELTKPYTFSSPTEGDAAEGNATEGGEEEDGGAETTKRSYEAGEQAEIDLATALALQESETATVVKLIRRRPLSDSLARLHGTLIPKQEKDSLTTDVRADGVAGLADRLRTEVAGLDRAEKQIQASLETVTGGIAQANDIAGQLREDLETWKRDAAEATRLATAFEKQLRQVATARSAAEQRVVELGRDLTAIVGRLTAEIDRVAPPLPR